MFSLSKRCEFPLRLLGLTFAALTCIVAAGAETAGIRFIDVPTDGDRPALTGLVWSPCAATAVDVMVGGVPLPGVKDCPIAGNQLPLIVFSHGRRGNFRGHHDTAETLADAGFIVAAINHPGDNSTAMSRTDELSVLIERPADIKRLTDYMLGTWPEAATIDPARVGLFGFSRGGYTGLVVIGGNPDFRAGLTYMCPPGSLMLKCQQIRENKVPPQPLVHDLRVKAAVLADPGYPFMFNRGGLKNVTIPVQLWRSERGGDGLVPEAVIALVPRFPKRPQYHVPAKSAHFSFLAPCLPEAMKAFPELCIDPPGFDRATFHKAFNAEVLAFFRQNLVKRSKP
jgi:predicted dienelactone hydrolase